LPIQAVEQGAGDHLSCRRKSGIGDDCLQQPPLVQEGNRSVGFGVDCR
jgi:hypothetical protein